MKTTKFAFVILLTALFTGTLFANEPVPVPREISSSVATLIQNEMDYPEFAVEEKLEDVVVLEVKIEDDGSLDVVSVNSIHDDMKKYAVETVENINTNSFAKYAGQTVLVKVKYDLLLY